MENKEEKNINVECDVLKNDVVKNEVKTLDFSRVELGDVGKNVEKKEIKDFELTESFMRVLEFVRSGSRCGSSDPNFEKKVWKILEKRNIKKRM